MGAGINVRKVAVADFHAKFDTRDVVREDIETFALAVAMTRTAGPATAFAFGVARSGITPHLEFSDLHVSAHGRKLRVY
jgi:hypothetical protein